MKMTFANRGQLLASAAFGILSVASSAQAQSAQGVDAGDIVVTARRVEERLQDVPISISVYSQEQLREKNIVDGQDLARYTPSLSADTRFGSDNTSFAIRGFNQDIGTAPSVGVYFADVVAPRGTTAGFNTGDGAGPGAFFDLQNVQVLKGPQGTLFGRNTTGGALLLVPQKPTDQLEGFIEGSVGNYGMLRTQGVVNIPLADTVRLRLGVDKLGRDGWLKNRSGIGPDDFNDIDYWTARASLVIDITPSIENYTIGSYTKSETNGTIQKLILANPASGLGGFAAQQLAAQAAAGEGFYDIRSTNRDAASRLRTWQAINTTTFTASDNLRIKNIVSYGELKQSLRSALFGTQFSTPAIAALGVPSFPIDFTNVTPAPQGTGAADQTTFTEELQFQGNTSDGRLNWQAGAYYERTRPKSVTGALSPAVLTCSGPLECNDTLGYVSSLNPQALPLILRGLIPPIQAGSAGLSLVRYWTRDIGVYAQATVELTSQLKLTGGIRYTWDKQRAESQLGQYRFPYTINPLTLQPTFGAAPVLACTRPGDTLPCVRNIETESSAPTWVVGVDFKPVDDVLLYAKYSRGYRTGGITGSAPALYNTYGPEKVDTYELGFKSSFGGDLRGTFNVSAFYNDFSNQQIQIGFQDNPAVAGTVSNITAPTNAGKSRIYGVEVEAGLRPFTGLSLQASYAYLNTKIKSILPVTLPATDPYQVNSTPGVGDELANTPEHKLVLTGTYTLPLDESIGDISFGATYIYTSSYRSNYADRAFLALTGGVDLGVIRPTNLVNLNVDWRSVMGTPVDLSFFATNVTKQKYYTSVSGLLPSGFEAANLGEPRMYGVRLRVRFGD